ncbi:ZIP zinc transporter [Methylovorus sp. MM2]|uniref:ZIP family metal transporter n=1 Tax=Methylovorus sp. MM2 TaxID=1848038 RepID=UPI0007E17384|nr:ZIP family metal transporter [Methylovorus sp. MM2]OAM53109.1 ZIP zinc transporter [Methylovorus sp. MM2]
MSTLVLIILTSLAGGVLSVLCAAFLALNTRTSWIPMLISYAIGALLGAAFLEILPHAFSEASSVENMAATVLFGILLFFVLEKLVLWRHCHGDECEAHAVEHNHTHAHKHEEHDHGRSGMMIMVGDTFHNFVDGILIAAAFMTDVKLGFVTAIAIIAHEIPQEVGDFLILLHSGYSKKRALFFNLFSSFATVVGGLIAYFSLQTVHEWIPSILGLAAASMIYVAVADLIPGLHKRTELKATIQQVVLIVLGIASIALTKFVLE